MTRPEPAFHSTVVVVSTHVPPHVGGVERFSEGLIAALERRGHVVSLVTTTVNSDRPGFVVPSIALLGDRVPIPISPLAVRRIARSLYGHAEQPVTILQTRLYPLCWLFALVARRANSRTIVVDHSTGHVSVATRWGQPIVDAIEHAGTSVLRYVDPTFLAVSEASAVWLRRHFGITVDGILPNAVEMPRSRRPARRSSTERVALFAGRLVEGKGIGELTSTFERLAERQSRWRLSVIGAGDAHQTYRDTANVTFHGSVAHDTVMHALDGADAVILPSTYPEGLPTIALEAGARGVPLVATRQGGLAELLGDGARGTILPDASAHSIEQALLAFDRDPELIEIRAAALRDYVLRNHSWEIVLSRLEPFLRTVR